MKELKLSKTGIIVLYVMMASLCILGITALVLPDNVYYAIGDSHPEVGRYVWFILFEFLALVTLIRTIIFISKRKKEEILISEFNKLREQLGENAFFVCGYCKAINKDNSDAIKTSISVFCATVFSLLFGIGVYRIYSTDIRRIFLISDDGLYIIYSQTREKLFLKKGSISTATLTETPKGQLQLTCPNENFVLTFVTKKTDVDNNLLTQKLKELFFEDSATIEKV